MATHVTEEFVERAIASFSNNDTQGLCADLDAALAGAQTTADRGHLLLARSIIWSPDRSLLDARNDLVEATGLLELAGEYVQLATATTYLSLTLLRLREVDEAIDHAVRAILIIDELDEEEVAAQPIALINLASIFQRLNAFDTAVAYAQRAVDSYEGNSSDGLGLYLELSLAECALEAIWQCGVDEGICVETHLAVAGAAADRIDPGISSYAAIGRGWIRAECALLENDLDRAETEGLAVTVTNSPFEEWLGSHVCLLEGMLAHRLGRIGDAVRIFDSLESTLDHRPLLMHRLLRARSDAHRSLGKFELALRDAQKLTSLLHARQIRYVAALINQVDSRAAAEQSRFALAEEATQLAERTRRDSLTGLASRSWFDTCLAERTEETGGVALVLIDIDYFKLVNDTYSHVVGDEVLRRVGRLLGESCRTDDLVARFGGEEFVVMPSDADLVRAHALGERLRKLIERESWDEVAPGLSVTISAGVSVGPAKSSADVFQAADDALYEAKREGRNSVIAHRLDRRLALAEEVSTASDALDEADSEVLASVFARR